MNTLSSLKQGLEGTWRSVGEGWRHLREQASGALTRFTPQSRTSASSSETDSSASASTSLADWQFPSAGWALLAGDLFEDDDKYIVRLEIPGLDKQDIDLEIRNDLLVVRGEKRHEHASTQGRYRVRQCAYGSFHRSIALPKAVLGDQAKAEYRNGVLRIELPKAAQPQGRRIEVRSE
ncbi:MAG: Hsp20/alpha crystallin family protein [Pseudomonadota bacterium]